MARILPGPRGARVLRGPWAVVRPRRPEPAPEYPYLQGLWTRYTRILGPLPDPGDDEVPNRGELDGFGYPEPMAPTSAASVDTGYAPDGETTMTVITGTQLMRAWLHADVGPDGPYTANDGILAFMHSMDLSRINNADLAVLLRGGNGTGGSPVSWLHVDAQTGNEIRIRAITNDVTVDDITPTTWVVPSLLAGTANKDSWVMGAFRWEWVTEPTLRRWWAVIVYDLGAGAGPQVVYDDTWTTVTTIDGPVDDITRVQTQPQTFGALHWTPVSDEDRWYGLIRAMLYEQGVDSRALGVTP